MLSITECDTIATLFDEDKDFTLLKVQKYDVEDGIFYLVFMRYLSNDFKFLLKKDNANYIVVKIYCDRSFIISYENKDSHTPSSPIVISKPTANFELETITNFAFSLKDVRLICQKMLNATFAFSEKETYKIANYEKDVF